MAKTNRLLIAVKELLFREWDPLRVNDCDECLTEYDSYAVTIVHLLGADADAYKLTAYLGRFQRESMGLTTLNAERDGRVAQRLRALIENKHH